MCCYDAGGVSCNNEPLVLMSIYCVPDVLNILDLIMKILQDRVLISAFILEAIEF